MPERDSASVHRVLLVEDDPHTRARLARVVEADARLSLVAAAESCTEARLALAHGAPDVLLTDLDLPDGSGIDLILGLRAAGASTLAMVITVFGDEKHVIAAIEAGALGYLLKDGTADYIADSICDLVAGGSPISPPIARYLMRRFNAPSPPAPAAVSAAELPHLSERETEVLTLVVKGFSYGEIAALLGVSAHTIATHARRLYQKLAVHSRSEAVYEALQLGIVKLDD